MRQFTIILGVASALICVTASIQAQNFPVQLIPEFDLTGDQIEVIQGYYQGGADPIRVSFGIYDTGASVVTLNWTDQFAYGTDGVPIKVPGGAVADGIDGQVIGDVSQPGTVISDGLHAFTFDINSPDYYTITWNYQGTGSGPYSAVVPGVQVFVGTDSGSASLPTISGTPMHYSQNHVGGGAAYINKKGYVFDLHEMFPELIPDSVPYYMADLQYVDSGTNLQTPTGPNMSGPFRVPITMMGGDNYADPGDDVTYAPNPFVSNVGLTMEGDSDPISVAGKKFLFDTGAMISVISTETALALGLDPYSGPYEIDIAGAAGASTTVYGHSLSLLEVPYDNLDGTTSGLIQFTDVPIFVLDVGEGIDGILGMNMFNLVSEMLYDPNDPDGASLELIFDLSEREAELPMDPELQALYELSFSDFFVNTVGYFPGMIPKANAVPEPGTFVLLAIGGLFLICVRVVRRRR